MVVLTSESIVIIECTLTHNHFSANGHLPFTNHSIDQNKDVGDGRHPMTDDAVAYSGTR